MLLSIKTGLEPLIFGAVNLTTIKNFLATNNNFKLCAETTCQALQYVP